MSTAPKPFRTVLLYSAGHLGSAIILNRLLNSPEFQIVAIVKAQTLPFNRKGAKKLKKHLKKVGWRFGWLLFWQQLIQAIAYLITHLIPFTQKKFSPGWALAKEKGIPVFHCGNINAPECCEFIASFKPDLLISAYFNQILKKEVIQLPKQGTLNVHPGWLPAYRGAMCYFWVLKNGEEKGGVSVHWIDEGIDTGKVLARKTFLLKPGWTQQKVLVLTATIGARLLRKVGKKLQQGEKIPAVPQIEVEKASYYPMPSEEDFNHYFAKRRFFRIRDIFAFFWRSLSQKKHPSEE